MKTLEAFSRYSKNNVYKSSTVTSPSKKTDIPQKPPNDHSSSVRDGDLLALPILFHNGRWLILKAAMVTVSSWVHRSSLTLALTVYLSSLWQWLLSLREGVWHTCQGSSLPSPPPFSCQLAQGPESSWHPFSPLPLLSRPHFFSPPALFLLNYIFGVTEQTCVLSMHKLHTWYRRSWLPGRRITRLRPRWLLYILWWNWG